MFKKIIMFFVGVIFFSGFHLAFAGLIINEIMYDLEGADTGREWVEIYNNSDAPVDLSAFKFFEAETNHNLTLIEGDANIGAFGYAVIVSDPVKFKMDWPNFSGIILDSSFSLSNEGEALALKDGNLNIVDQYTYSSTTGAIGDGNSLQKVSGSWIGAMPTPGATNETATPPSPPPLSDSGSSGNSSSGGGDSSSSSLTATETKTKIAEEPKVRVQISAKMLAFVGLPLSFQATAFGYNKEQLFSGKYFWNFGDGGSKETQVNSTEKLTHTYFYPGDYVVTLEYYMNYYGDVPDASDKIIIKIVPADILISGVGDEKDFFVELSNNTNYDADLSNWILFSDRKSFTFPRNTVVGSKKKIIISSKITNFSIEDKNTLKLMTPQRELSFHYSSFITPAAPIKTADKTTAQPKVSPAVKPLEESVIFVPDEQIPVENLPASVIQSQSDIVQGETSNNMYTIIISFLSIIFIGASASAVYFLRQKKIQKNIVSSVGSDFEILDK